MKNVYPLSDNNHSPQTKADSAIIGNKPDAIASWKWYVSISFSNSNSVNFQRAIFLARSADYFLESEYKDDIIYQAFYKSDPASYLKFIQLYELISGWKSAFVMINGELVDRKIIQGINYCYGDKCRSGRSDFCFGASFMTQNPFGCHRLQISAYNHPWWTFSRRVADGYQIDKAAILKHAQEYGTAYRLCPSYDQDYINRAILNLPDFLTQTKYDKMNDNDDFDISIEPQIAQYNALKLPRKTKRSIVTILLCVFFGFIGAHYFYNRKYWQGILYLCTAGLLYIGWISDILRIVKKQKFLLE